MPACLFHSDSSDELETSCDAFSSRPTLGSAIPERVWHAPLSVSVNQCVISVLPVMRKYRGAHPRVVEFVATSASENLTKLRADPLRYWNAADVPSDLRRRGRQTAPQNPSGIACARLAGWQALFDSLCHTFNRSVLTQLLDTFVSGDLLKSHSLGNLSIHAQYRRDFLFGQ